LIPNVNLAPLLQKKDASEEGKPENAHGPRVKGSGKRVDSNRNSPKNTFFARDASLRSPHKLHFS